MKEFEWVDKDYFYLLLLLPLVLFILIRYRHYRFPSFSLFGSYTYASGVNFFGRFYPYLTSLKVLALILLILALARPRLSESSVENQENQGIDIVMAVDVSASMLSKDLKPNRLEALKKVAADFVDRRSADKIGLVAYSGESFTLCPLTVDKKAIKAAISRIKFGLLEGGTAIGMGLGTALNRMKGSEAKSKVIVLLTDGVNTEGAIDPKTMAEIAVEEQVKIYTIAIGTNGTAPTPVAYDASGDMIFRNMPVKIDEALLKEIAAMTQGKYFRATDNKKLKEIYGEIDQLEKYEFKTFKYFTYEELFRYLLVPAFLLIVIEMILGMTRFRSIV